MDMIRLLCGFTLLILAACGPAKEAEAPATPVAAAPATPSLEFLWVLSGLSNPESVVLSADGKSLYISNVNGEGEAKDGNGFISRVSADGKTTHPDWSTGFDGPKGIALSGSTLYVADIDQVVAVDAETGAIQSRTPLIGAKFLNDTAIAPDGRVLVADSDTSRIYSVTSGEPEVWLEDRLLQSINGLLPEPNRLVVTTMAGRLLAVDYQSKAITVLAEGLGDADGVSAIGGGRYLVSEWPGLMHVVNPDGSHTTILDTRAEKRLLNDFILVGDTLYQPNWDPGELTAYRLVGAMP
jgi:DNA-binding beta-propeller fold protein YncE